MRKSACSLIGLLMIFSTLPADAQKNSVGIIGGMNFADLQTDVKELETNPRAMFAFGGIFSRRIKENIYLHLEPMYLQKGAHGRNLGDFDIDIDATLAFFEMPLYCRVVLDEKQRSHFLIGPTFGFLLSSEAEWMSGGERFEANLEDITERLDIGLGLGIGFNLPVGKGSIFLDGRYTVGLTNLNKGGTVVGRSTSETMTEEIGAGIDVSSRGFQIILGYIFPLGARPQAGKSTSP